MDETPGPLQRALTWLQATPAEAAGLVVLLLGAVAATGGLVWQAGQRPDPPPPPAADVGEDAFATDGAGDAQAEGTVDAHADGQASPADDPAGTGPADAPPTTLVVHVTGAVARPGVVTLDGGARVTDAIEAAGGATDLAMVDYVNLARPLQDGEHVHLPREGEEPPPTTAGPGPTGDDGTELVDLNQASAEQLQTLPGIGPAKSAAIVDHREEHGDFAVPGDLRDVPGIGEATFQRLADRVTVS